MDFSDQIALAAGSRSSTRRGRGGARATYAVVLLDEYQDTSVAQALLGALFSGLARAGRGHAVTVVGDPNQAIYGWRGASVSNLLSLGRTFPRADGSDGSSRLLLATSRRSDRRILEVANLLAAPLYESLDQVRPLAASPTRGRGRPCAAAPSLEHELAALPDAGARDQARWPRSADAGHGAGSAC